MSAALGAAVPVVEHLVDRLGEPPLVGLVDQPVGEDALALVLPQPEQRDVGAQHLADVAHEDALEDAAEVAQVEDVVELGGRRQHLRLHLRPHVDRHLDQLVRRLPHVANLVLRPLGNCARTMLPKIWLIARDRRQRHVEHVEVALRAVGDVVLAAARLEHRAQEEQVLDRLPLARLVEVVQPARLHQLADDLEGDLVAPLVVRRHRDVVDEDEHLLAARRPEGLALPLLDARLHLPLEDDRRRRARERNLLRQRRRLVLLVEELQHRRRLRGARPADEQHGAAERDREAERVLVAHGVDRRHEDRRKLVAQIRPAAARSRGSGAPSAPTRRSPRRRGTRTPCRAPACRGARRRAAWRTPCSAASRRPSRGRRPPGCRRPSRSSRRRRGGRSPAGRARPPPCRRRRAAPRAASPSTRGARSACTPCTCCTRGR